MPDTGSGILDRAVHETPIAVVDFETTGLSAGADRVVEVSVVRVEPGGGPRLVLDTLVNPLRPMAATEIHGITERDVAGAPTFSEIAGDFLESISDSVVASYNVYFDIGFLEFELRNAGVRLMPPHFCLMYLRPMLSLGKRCCLEDACLASGILMTTAHMSSADAQASAQLLQVYLQIMRERRIMTFGDLGSIKQYKFVDSFRHGPYPRSMVAGLARSGRRKSRARVEVQPPPLPAASAPVAPIARQKPANPLGAYWDALKVVLADLQVTEDEVEELARTKHELGLRDEQVRSLHARAFASALLSFADDRLIDDRECEVLNRLRCCLSRLGWAPGEA